MTDPENPYATPINEASQVHFPQPDTGNPLVMPAIFILVFAIPYLLLLMLGAIGGVTQSATNNSAYDAGYFAGQLAFLLLMLSTTALEIFGAISMLQMKRYGFALTAAILSMIPICSPCYVFGIPFGIWALVILLKPNVKDRFS